MCLGPTIEHPSPGPAGLSGHQRHFQPLLAEASALSRHRGGGNLQGIGDALVGPSVGAISVGLEKYASVEQLSGVSSATADKRFELAALLFGVANDILLVRGENPRFGLVPKRGYLLSFYYSTKL